MDQMAFSWLVKLLIAMIAFIAIDQGNACLCGTGNSNSLHIGDKISFNSDRKRRSADQNGDAAAILRLCDTNRNLMLSASELRKCMLIPATATLANIKGLRSDGDGRLALTNTANLQFDTSAAGNCYQAMLMKCGMRYIMFSRMHGSDKQSASGSFQEYVDCFAMDDESCDLPIITSYKQALIDKIENSKKDDAPPIVDISALGKGLSAGEDKISDMPCSLRVIFDCDVKFVGDLHDGVDLCHSLAGYEQCIKGSTKNCDEDPVRYARAAAHSLVRAYLATNLCY